MDNALFSVPSKSTEFIRNMSKVSLRKIVMITTIIIIKNKIKIK